MQQDPKCPVCNGDMWDNTQNKKTTKSPDYTCKNKDCRWTLDRKTNSYVAGKYPTSVWLEKSAPKVNAGTAKFEQGLQNDIQNDLKNESIEKLNAKNNAALWVAHGIVPKEDYGAWCDYIYSHTPKKMPLNDNFPQPKTRAGEIIQKAMQEAEVSTEQDKEVGLADLPF